ncbi:hypothetical protein PC129_g18862 [Phytophthora cactorum]|uniref:Uncharacterized protein n=1 Tax=Phytophthora cactorum TaxID=29920 RepID=A0A329SCV7_9STRA|nr:hypothetical protein Pcac1_g748 [Phytophthora cactorum]KAG2801416.1 hypothetical protein PC112_g20049 [Phytophthora cactorum]KAG2836484.1 hypothetical protein PC111_g5003 [Phytophthora cactorum]KAG2836905.1 hypothetical protein PC113_g19931 [Phytophthora cactorum]KAG2880787.1 hypothetical protein PC114_g21889 [Phytophthora cactorum]
MEHVPSTTERLDRRASTTTASTPTRRRAKERCRRRREAGGVGRLIVLPVLREHWSELVPLDNSTALEEEPWNLTKRSNETVPQVYRRLKELLRMFAEFPVSAESIP